MFKFDSKIKDIVGDHASIEDIVGPELNGVLDRKLWEETIELQKKFNDNVAPGWESKEYDFWMATLDETIEVLNSRHWKWWKDKRNFNKVDWENVEVELIDIFLFILSITIKEDIEEVLYITLASAEMTKNQDEKGFKLRDAKFFEDFWEQFLTPVTLKTSSLVAVKWVEFWFRSGGTIERLLKQFRVKVALNNIRQEFGYASGGYEKDWGGVEDNVIAWELANNMPLDTDLLENLTDALRKYYLEKVAL